jgi:DNA-directed RNA polymerase specialized sigma24 family protein
MIRSTIGRRLTVEALARLHAPRTAEELRAACHEMAGRGMSYHTIARATGLSVEAVQRLLQELAS